MNRWAVCLFNAETRASLEIRKLYEVLSDAEAEGMDFLRVIDESGEDYLYPRSLFGEVEITEEISDALRRAS
ncbi:hypothetical protein [Longimicrobium sp.]|uniref:hypothetical protein n=1 Tax=Longimicrobium sp. TaxID=2029185 RepID=UPI002C82D487|nr:hypothetical protein [Longimicrobium sp.]HSU14696.1 hypothetical protein [Longimicrobium sp.]